jgi:hypothetical protein
MKVSDLAPKVRVFEAIAKNIQQVGSLTANLQHHAG